MTTATHPNSTFNGSRFGRLTVTGYSGACRNGSKWDCTCSCGASCVVSRCHLVSGHTTSCGCLQRESARARKTHGMRRTRVYSIWSGMVSRCRATGGKNAENYSRRGISVCQRWLSFENFLSDMGEPPIGSTIDRRDNNGGYNKGNCRWATVIQQANNTRANRYITAMGETKSLSDWSRDGRCMVRYHVLQARIRRGWDVTEAITSRLGRRNVGVVK